MNAHRAARARSRRRARCQSGFTLLETAIATLVLAFGLLGAAALQISTMKNYQSSLQRSQAVMLSYYMLDALRANRADAATGTYNRGKTCTVPASGTTLASDEHNFWLQAIKDNLGNAATSCGEISCATTTGVTTCTVKIHWADDRGTGGSSSQFFETATQL